MNRNKTAVTGLALLTIATGCIPGCALTQSDTEETRSELIEGFPEASLTIFPLTVFWTGLTFRSEGDHAWAAAYERGFREDKARPFADTLGLLLAEKGYDKYEVAEACVEFSADKSGRKARVAAFGKFVSELDLKTDYALYTEFVLHAGEGGLNAYSVIVDANGRIAWKDSQERHGRTELDALEAACNRLIPVMGLDMLPKKEMAADKKRMLWEIRAKEPPSGSERAAMRERLKILKEAGASARVLVYPARVGGDRTDPACATRLTKLLNEARLCQASVAKTAPVMEGSGWPNEMQVLWLFARNVREYVSENPTDCDYVLFADYWFNPHGQVWAVHFVVCDRAGDWVIADLQNSHQEDFQQANPKDLQDCDQLVLKRLEAYLR